MGGASQTFRERSSELVVRAAIVVNAKLSSLVRPGSFLILAFVSLFAIGSLMKGAAFPSQDIWKSGSPAVYGLVFCGAVTYLGYFLVIWGYGRLLKAREKDDELYRACRDVASLVERTAGLDRAKIGVHVWAVRGLRGARRLERRATFVPGTRTPTAIVWRRGKGAIGRCWERDEWILADLEELQTLALNEAAFSALPAEERFFLTWSEFKSTDHYKAVLAWPLHGGPEAAAHVVGCLSIDVQEAGAAGALETFRNTQRGPFGELVAVCQVVLRDA